VSGGDHRWFKRSTRMKRPVIRDDDDDNNNDDNNNNNKRHDRACAQIDF